VPALAYDIGKKIWLPSSLAKKDASDEQLNNVTA